MKTYRKALLIVSALAITVSVAFASPAVQKQESKANAKQSQKAPAAKPATHTVQGTIVSITPDSVTIREADGKEMTLALDSQTQRSGNLVVGSRLTAHYRDEGGKHAATSVQERVAAAKKPKSKK